MHIRYILLATILSACVISSQKEAFENELIKSLGYTKCLTYQIQDGDTTLNRVDFYDTNGRQDSTVSFIGVPEAQYYEKFAYKGNDRVAYSTKRYAFDEKGKTLIFENYTIQDNVEVEIYYSHDGRIASFSKFTNNEDGLNKLKEHYFADSVLVYFTRYTYNDNNQLIKSQKYRPDSTLIGYRTFLYGSCDLMAEEESTYIDEQLYSKISRKFNKDCNLTEQVEYDREQNITTSSSFQYYDNRLIKSSQINGFAALEGIVWLSKYE